MLLRGLSLPQLGHLRNVCVGANCGYVSLCLHRGEPTTGAGQSNIFICLNMRPITLSQLNITREPTEAEKCR